MFYFQKYNLAFLHIAKTGGTSFRTMLTKELGTKTEVQKETYHEPLRIKRDVLGIAIFNSINVVTLIRNPFATVVSYYFWIHCDKLSSNDGLKPKVARRYPFLKAAHGLSFADFVDWYVKNEKSYADYLLVDGQLPTNVYMIKLENLKRDADRVLNTQLDLNLKLDIPHIYKTRHKPFMEYYTEELSDKIVEKYKWTFDNRFYT